jgi:hypothetical protein
MLYKVVVCAVLVAQAHVVSGWQVPATIPARHAHVVGRSVAPACAVQGMPGDASASREAARRTADASMCGILAIVNSKLSPEALRL